MCGIAGMLDLCRETSAEELETTVKLMAAALAHRGPDDGGVWVDPVAGIALGHRRLSVIDLSPQGHQPMMSASGRYVVAYNGEIYNYRELRDLLVASRHSFRSHSDTEVLLEAIEEWGFPGALTRLNGMFALALWDRSTSQLALARDRFGEKPLYFGTQGKTLLFGSELKALRAHPAFRPVIDRSALAQYLRFAYVPTPRCIYAGLQKLPPATWARVRRDGSGLDIEPYWSMIDVACQGTQHRTRLSDGEAVEELDRLLRESIRIRMVADVPLGAFLSGGVDSSTVVALMQAQSPAPIRTYTMGFSERQYDEAAAAKAVATHLGTLHTELYVTPDEAQAVISILPLLYDEPFADSSQIPTFLVSKLARSEVTVVLSGDGGDELFGGYNRYVWAETIWRTLSAFPLRARSALATLLGLARPSIIDHLSELLEPALPRRLRQRIPGDKIHKLSEVMSARDPDDLYLRLASTWKDPSAIVGTDEPRHELLLDQPSNFSDFTERMMYCDTVTYLPDDILVKVDRATMGVSLEARVPMLDPSVASFAWSLPTHQRIRRGISKWIVREVLARYLPRSLFERPKMGFGVPIDTWLRGPLRDWAEALLSEDRLRSEGYFAPTPIRKKWQEHLSGRRNWQPDLWCILMFQAWLEHSSRVKTTPGRSDPRPLSSLTQHSSVLTTCR
jgi:asparagine synthase (glutamine-hydrolysing)